MTSDPKGLGAVFDAARLPVTGAGQATRLLDPSLPSNTLIPRG
jgi:hypothetical protein